MEKALLQKKEEIDKLIERRLSPKVDENNLRIAMELVGAIRKIETFIFDERTKVNFIKESNGWGAEASFYSENAEYDIYLPDLYVKFNETKIIFPIEAVIKNRVKKIIFIVAHKIRHRIQEEMNVELITPYVKTDNMLLSSIINTIGDNKEHNTCSCSVLKNPELLQEKEFDALVVQHYVLSRLGMTINWGSLKSVPIFAWRGVVQDLFVEP